MLPLCWIGRRIVEGGGKARRRWHCHVQAFSIEFSLSLFVVARFQFLFSLLSSFSSSSFSVYYGPSKNGANLISCLFFSPLSLSLSFLLLLLYRLPIVASYQSTSWTKPKPGLYLPGAGHGAGGALQRHRADPDRNLKSRVAHGHQLLLQNVLLIKLTVSSAAAAAKAADAAVAVAAAAAATNAVAVAANANSGATDFNIVAVGVAAAVAAAHNTHAATAQGG